MKDHSFKAWTCSSFNSSKEWNALLSLFLELLSFVDLTELKVLYGGHELDALRDMTIFEFCKTNISVLFDFSYF